MYINKIGMCNIYVYVKYQGIKKEGEYIFSSQRRVIGDVNWVQRIELEFRLKEVYVCLCVGRARYWEKRSLFRGKRISKIQRNENVQDIQLIVKREVWFMRRNNG